MYGSYASPAEPFAEQTVLPKMCVVGARNRGPVGSPIVVVVMFRFPNESARSRMFDGFLVNA